LKDRPDSIVVFCENGLLLPIGAACRWAGRPAFWLMPNMVSADYPLDLNRRIYQWAFRAFRLFPIANSKSTRLSLGRAGAVAGEINLGVDPAIFGAEVSAAPSPFKAPGAVVMLVMARLVPEKGQLALLEALLSRPSLSCIHMVVCGGPLDTPYSRQIIDAAAQAGASTRLSLVGPVADPRPWYKLSDFVASVRIDPEPFGLSIVEAMMARRPVLVHASGGPEDIVVDGETGWHIHGVELNTIADGLEKVMADRHNWFSMGSAGFLRAMQNYTIESMTADFIAAVRQKIREIV
jgi:glycosyltransferase involved in cell wall biosynthesis